MVFLSAPFTFHFTVHKISFQTILQYTFTQNQFIAAKKQIYKNTFLSSFWELFEVRVDFKRKEVPTKCVNKCVSKEILMIENQTASIFGIFILLQKSSSPLQSDRSSPLLSNLCWPWMTISDLFFLFNIPKIVVFILEGFPYRFIKG